MMKKYQMKKVVLKKKDEKKHAGLNELICNTCWFSNF